MTTVYDVPANILVERVKEELKELEEIHPPEWSRFVKTGVSRERPPEDKDWWYKRAASLMRRLYLDGPVGVTKLSRFYGKRKNRGHKPEKFRKGSEAILRRLLSQLKNAGYVKTSKKGRELTPEGISFLDRLSFEVKSRVEKEYPGLERY
ncbi:MAG: 30S ribosomal protein S19e [Candidatus Methanofastidiosia archaeon]